MKIPTFDNEEIETSELNSEAITNRLNKDIVILDVSENNQKYEIINLLNNGNSIISDFKNREK